MNSGLLEAVNSSILCCTTDEQNSPEYMVFKRKTLPAGEVFAKMSQCCLASHFFQKVDLALPSSQVV